MVFGLVYRRQQPGTIHAGDGDHEHFPTLGDWNIRILATDISKKMLDKCHVAIFLASKSIAGSLPARNLVPFFDRSGSVWTAKRNCKAQSTSRNST